MLSLLWRLGVQPEVLRIVRRDFDQGDVLLQVTSASEDERCALDGVNGNNVKIPRTVKVSDLHSLDMSTLLVLGVS